MSWAPGWVGWWSPRRLRNRPWWPDTGRHGFEKWGDLWDDHGMNDASKAMKKDGTHPRTKSGSKSRKCQKLGVFSSDIYLGCSAVNYHQKPHITSYYHVFATSEDIILPGPFAQLTIGVPLTPLSANNGPLALRPGSHVMNSPGYEVVTWRQKSEPPMCPRTVISVWTVKHEQPKYPYVKSTLAFG